MIGDTPLGGAIDEPARAGLRPTFEIDVERTTFLWRAGETLIEVAIDQGSLREIAAPGRTLEISELELELKHGDPEAAFVLARMLAARAPLQLSLISKAERGQLLTASAVALPAKASRPRLADDMTIGAAFMAICQSCLRDFMLNAVALDGDDPVEAVHQGRVALRRLRAALALFRPATGGGGVRMNSQLKWLADIFGVARDSDILSARSSASSPDSSAPSPDSSNPTPNSSDLDKDGKTPSSFPAAASAEAMDFSQWRAARRLAAYKAVRAAVQSKRWRIFLIDLVEWIENVEQAARAHDGADAMVRFVRKRLKRTREALLQAPRDLGRLDPQARHALRIKAKKLRYMAQFFTGVSGVADRAKLKLLLTRLDKLQSSLGELHDEEARRGVADAEISLWRSATGSAAPASRAAPDRPAAAIDAEAECLRKAIRAYAGLARDDPF